MGNFFLALNELYASYAQSYQGNNSNTFKSKLLNNPFYFSAVIVTNVIFGFVSAVGGPVLPSIIIEFLGPDNLAMGYGFLLIFEGVGSFAGPPLAGNLVREKISYDLITLFLVNSMMHASR